MYLLSSLVEDEYRRLHPHDTSEVVMGRLAFTDTKEFSTLLALTTSCMGLVGDITTQKSWKNIPGSHQEKVPGK